MEDIQQEIRNDIQKFINTCQRAFFDINDIKSKTVSPLSNNHPDQLKLVLVQLMDEGKITEEAHGYTIS